jgi:hypothetical protein
VNSFTLALQHRPAEKAPAIDGRDKLSRAGRNVFPSDKLDENTAAAISAVSQGPAGAVRIKMHNKLPALVALGKYLGMFDQRPQNSNVIYAISDEPMSAEEWKKQYVTDR